MKTDNIHSKLAFWLLILMVVFLPFSSWLISLTGNQNLTFIRDLIVIMLFLRSLFFRPKINKAVIVTGILFIIWSALSFFWKESSSLQWLKGWRYDIVPIIFFLSIYQIKFEDKQKKIILNTVLTIGGVISVLALFELFGFKIPLSTSLSGALALQPQHTVGATSIVRLQAVLAGPNALGLYLLAIIGFALSSRTKLTTYAASDLSEQAPLLQRSGMRGYLLLTTVLLVFTFSRSAWLGLIALIVVALWQYFSQRKMLNKFVIGLFITIILAFGGYLIIPKSLTVRQLLTHDSSNSERLEQYKRIWQEKNDIGLLGRGSGSAGPSSQLRLDGGPNRWTENVYLDIFEELGLVGLLLYLTLIFFVIRLAWQNHTSSYKFVLPLLCGFAVAGLFINYYTGQVGLYLMWLAAGLLPKESNEKNLN